MNMSCKVFNKEHIFIHMEMATTEYQFSQWLEKYKNFIWKQLLVKCGLKVFGETGSILTQHTDHCRRKQSEGVTAPPCEWCSAFLESKYLTLKLYWNLFQKK